MASVFLIHTPPSLIVIMGESRGFENSIHIVNEPSGVHILLDSLFWIGMLRRIWEMEKKTPGTFFFPTRRTLRNQEPTYLRQPLGKGLPFVQHTYIYQSNGVTYGQISKPLSTTFRKPPSWSSRVDFVEVLSTYQITCSPTARGGCDILLTTE